MRDYWISTPKFTCWIRFNNLGYIEDSAPILQKFKGQTRIALFTWLQKRFGNNFQVKQLEEIKNEYYT